MIECVILSNVRRSACQYFPAQPSDIALTPATYLGIILILLLLYYIYMQKDTWFVCVLMVNPITDPDNGNAMFLGWCETLSIIHV